jgi:hypothetical protein
MRRSVDVLLDHATRHAYRLNGGGCTSNTPLRHRVLFDGNATAITMSDNNLGRTQRNPISASPDVIFDFDHNSHVGLELISNSSLKKCSSATATTVLEKVDVIPISEERRRCIQWPRMWSWSWEMWACLGSLAAFLATVGLLRAYDGKSQPDWPYGITLNSAVSWLSTLTKGFLLVPLAACISQSIWIRYSSQAQSLANVAIYDSASRGPWGSFELIWTLQAKYYHTRVFIGPMLTISSDVLYVQVLSSPS